jgi:hypothetical protein
MNNVVLAQEDGVLSEHELDQLIAKFYHKF